MPSIRLMTMTSFFEIQVKELEAERNQSKITIIFRPLTGTRHKTRRRKVTSIPPTPIHPGAANPTIIPSVAATSVTPVTILTQVQGALTEVLNTPEVVKQELSVPETILPVTTANKESQLGASYLNNHTLQGIPNNNVSNIMCIHVQFELLHTGKSYSSKQNVKQ